MARLNTFVHVRDEHGHTHVFGPDENVPAWAEEAITNPKVWAEAPAGDPRAAEPKGSLADEPPRSGKGSGRDAWAAYAAARGVDVPDGAGREDIISALAEAGKIEAE